MRNSNKRYKTILGVIFLVFLIVSTIWILNGRGTATLRTTEGSIFGTTFHIKYEYTEPLDSDIVTELNRVDASLSVFNKESTISQINNGTIEKTDPMLFEVLTKARKISNATQGAFDVTVMPLVNAWGFGYKSGQLPSSQQVDSIRKYVGFHKMELASDSVVHKKDKRIMLDCGAIAKGYGVDRVARLLNKRNVRNYMIEIGGEVITKGRNPEGRPWQIGLSKPIDGANSERDIQTILSLENAALATSGNYHNFYVRDGKKYAHTIDPRTGYPVQHSLLSATVIAPDCAKADAYATSFMVLGLDNAKKVLAKHKELKAYFIYADNHGRLRVFTNYKQ